MQRVIGGLLILTATGGAGYVYGKELKRYLGRLLYFRYVMSLVKGEIAYTHAPLPEIFSEVARRVKEPYDRWLIRTAAEMASHDAAVYMNHPASIPDIGIEIPDETARKIEKAVLLFDDDGESGYLTGWLDMDSASSARTLSTLLRNELLKGIRQRGEKPDFAVLSGYFRPDGDILYIDYPGIDRGMVEAMAKASAGGV